MTSAPLDLANRIKTEIGCDYIFANVLGIKDVTDYVIHNSNGTEISKGRLTNNEKIEIKHLASNSLYFLKLEGLNTIKFFKK